MCQKVWPADEVDLLRPDAGLSAKRLHRLNVQLSQKKIHFAEIRRAGAVAAGQPQNFPANLPGKGLKYKAQLLDFGSRSMPGDPAQRRIHAVG